MIDISVSRRFQIIGLGLTGLEYISCLALIQTDANADSAATRLTGNNQVILGFQNWDKIGANQMVPGVFLTIRAELLTKLVPEFYLDGTLLLPNSVEEKARTQVPYR